MGDLTPNHRPDAETLVRALRAIVVALDEVTEHLSESDAFAALDAERGARVLAARRRAVDVLNQHDLNPRRA